jgi:toxin-antitoxin system PIN domain toxin
VKPYLLDVNVLIALAWPSHVHHALSQSWFAKKRKFGFRTCPLTQIGFVRLSSNPKFTPDAVSPREAVTMLESITALPDHKFWPADLGLPDTIAKLETIVGHRQITDAYLLTLAGSRKGILATLDRGTLALTGGKRHGVELLGTL